MVKTPEEIALAQRAMNYFSRIHAFARDYILSRGTDATDFEVQNEATRFGFDLIMADIRRDGRPHTAVGIDVRIGVRTGVGTAFPHPNQAHHNRIARGDALQVAGIVNIGGCGGELYRAYQIEPWDDVRKRVWDVHTECCRIQAEASAGRFRFRMGLVKQFVLLFSQKVLKRQRQKMREPILSARCNC